MFCLMRFVVYSGNYRSTFSVGVNTDPVTGSSIAEAKGIGREVRRTTGATVKSITKVLKVRVNAGQQLVY